MADGGEVQTTPESRSDRPYHALKAIPDIQERILAAVAEGRSLQSIANDYGVEAMAILNRAQRDFPDAYKAAARTGYELRMDRREKELESAASKVDVTRADRLLNHARWLAERSCPDRWGQKTEITGEVGLTVKVVRFGALVQGTSTRVNENGDASDAQVIDPA